MEEKKGEQKEADEEKDGDEEKKENRDEVSMNYDSLYQIPVEPTFYEDLKNCKFSRLSWFIFRY